MESACLSMQRKRKISFHSCGRNVIEFCPKCIVSEVDTLSPHVCVTWYLNGEITLSLVFRSLRKLIQKSQLKLAHTYLAAPTIQLSNGITALNKYLGRVAVTDPPPHPTLVLLLHSLVVVGQEELQLSACN